jgi:DMSO/TMAO reductase YedYZ molybdopterin-dependent catalytic subunit
MSEIEVSPADLSALHGGSTSAAAHFRRNHFPFPANAPGAIEVEGAVAQPLRLDLPGLRRFGLVEHDVVLECAGHRRAELDPPGEGVPWK